MLWLYSPCRAARYTEGRAVRLPLREALDIKGKSAVGREGHAHCASPSRKLLKTLNVTACAPPPTYYVGIRRCSAPSYDVGSWRAWCSICCKGGEANG